MEFNRKKLLDFLDNNPDKIPSMSKTLLLEIENNYKENIKVMSLYESFNYIYGNTRFINKKVINKARYGYY